MGQRARNRKRANIIQRHREGLPLSNDEWDGYNDDPENRTRRASPSHYRKYSYGG
jgi:hypothetical protein